MRLFTALDAWLGHPLDRSGDPVTFCLNGVEIPSSAFGFDWVAHWMWVLVFIHIVQVGFYLRYSLWTFKSYTEIPRRLHDKSEGFLVRQSSIEIFSDFILYCGKEHKEHGCLMFVHTLFMVPHLILMPHMPISWAAILASLVIWSRVIWIARRTALKSDTAARELVLR